MIVVSRVFAACHRCCCQSEIERDFSASCKIRPQAPVNGDTPPSEDLSENDSGVELTNENSPLTAAEPPSPFSLKQDGDAAATAAEAPGSTAENTHVHRVAWKCVGSAA